MGLDWDAAHEVIPANGDQLSEADDRLRETKDQVRKRMQGEHRFGNGFGIGTDDNGLHLDGSARCFYQASAPTALTDSAGDYNASTDNDLAITDLNDSASGSGGAIADDVGHGRCWVDSDDNKMYIYRGVAGNNNGGWVPVAGVGEGQYSLVYNGDFNATGGDGLVASTTVPAGWADAAGETPTYSYTDPSTDIVWGDGLMLSVTNAGAANEGVQYEMDSMAASSTYLVVVRAQDDGTAVCTLTVTGNGGTAFAAVTGEVAVTAGGNAWTTLMGTFTTAAAFDDDVLLVLDTTGADTLVCNYSHVAVYKIDGDEVSQGGTSVYFAETTNENAALGGAFADVTAGFEIAVTPPRQGCIIEVHSSISITIPQNKTVACSIDEDDGAAQNVGIDEIGTPATGGASTQTFNSFWMLANPAPGTPITYTPQCVGDNTSTYHCRDGLGHLSDCAIWAKMTCGAN